MIATKPKKAPAKSSKRATSTKSPAKTTKQSSTKSASIFFRSLYEYKSIAELDTIPKQLRGLYMLFMGDGAHMNLVYVGMSEKGMLGRLKKHAKERAGKWTHCSVYEVWDNIHGAQIRELEALFQHALKKDAQAIVLNRQVRSSIWGRLKKDTAARNSALSKTQPVAKSGPRPKPRPRA